MDTRHWLAVVLVAATATGCASIESKPGFSEVREAVEARTGSTVHWREGGPEDAAVREQVRKLLGQPVGVDAAVQIALLANPRLQAVYEDLGVAQADLVQAGLLRNPVFAATVLYPREESGKNLDFEVAWDFLGVFTMPLRKRAAEQDFERAKLRVTAAVLDLAAEVREAFHQAQANRQLVEMLEQVTAATGATLTTTRELREAGNVTRLALDRERAVHEEARLLLAKAEAALVESRERLDALMGVWGTATRWEMDDRLPEVPAEPLDIATLEQRAVERSLDLAMTRLELEAAAKRIGVSDLNSVIPDAEIGWAWERDDGEWEDGPTVAFPLPIFDLGQARRARTRAELDRLRARYVEQAIAVRSAARRAAVALEAARARERHLREVLLPLREHITRGELLQYNAMQVGVFRLVQARQRQVATGQRYVQALRDYWLARARVEQILNGRMPADGGGAASAPAPAGGMGDDGGGH